MIEAILNRHSVRKFTEQPVEEEKLQLVLKAAMQAPSAKNSQPWEFFVIRDKEVMEKLSRVQPYGASAKNAPVLIVPICNEQRYTDELDAFWQEDLSATTQTILLAASALGLGTTWLALAPLQERIDGARAVLGLPEHMVPFALLPLGYPLKEKAVVSRYDAARIHYIPAEKAE